MKKILALLLVLVMVFSLASCGFSGVESSTTTTTKLPSTTQPTTTQPTTTKPNPGEDKLYNAFTPAEKKLFEDYFGLVIPFIPNDEYYVEEYSNEYEDGTIESGINFYAWNNTKKEFNAYQSKLDSLYEYQGMEADEYGDNWYYYAISDEVYLDISYYLADDGYVVDVYVYTYTESSGGGSGSGSGSGSTDTKHTYSNFTSSEKSLFNQLVGEVIPFIPNDEYYVEEYDDGECIGVNFYTFGNTQAEFNAYKNQIASLYSYDGSETDEYGDMWYYYTTTKGNYFDISFYYYEGDYVVDIYVYCEASSGGETGSGSGSGSGSTGSNDDLITNEGAGLPTGTNGVFNIDFRKADKVKDVTDQGYYLDGCPTTGSPAVLVIPVEFSDVTAQSKGYTTSALAQAFSEGGDVDYYSVYDYYYISSYGNLTLDITVLDEWFRPEKNSSYYYKATYDYYGDQVAIGDQLILDEALAYLEGKMDLSKFDSDDNGIIDAVVLVNTLDVGEEDFYWAYRYWNIYTDNNGYYYEYDGVSANDYVWASYQFLNEGIDENGETYYDSSIMNTYTFIHEFAHILGLDDYYDTSYNGDGPLDGADMMDAMMGDHNAYSKFNLGWITTSRLVVTNSSVTLKLEDFSKTGDTIILANNWDEKLGAYQEYYVLMYYKNEGLNAGDDAGFFARDGVLIYHVNASLYSEVYDGETYYDVYNNNTDASDQYGTKDNLIEFVKSAGDTFTYIAGDTLPNNVVDDNGEALKYTFTIDALTSDYVTITFTVK